MKRLLGARSVSLIVLLLATGCSAALMIVLWAGPIASASPSFPNAAAQSDALPVMPLVRDADNSVAAPAFNCTIVYTTTADAVGGNTGNDFSNPAPIATYYGLSLVGSAYPGQTKPAFTETFKLNNAIAGTIYKVDAVPDETDNYNMGIIVYDNNQNPVCTDVDTSNQSFKASCTFTASGLVPWYYVKVFQVVPGCSGGTYDFIYSSVPTPTPTPSITPSPTPSPSPTPTTQPWTLQDQYEPNDDINHAANPSSNPVTGLTLYSTAFSDPSDDQDWFIIYGSAGYEYSINVVPESGYAYPYLFLEVIGPDKTTVIGQVPSSNNATVSWTASASGLYYVFIKRAGSSPTNGTYKLSWSTNAPTGTPTQTYTPTPGPGEPTETPVPGLDAFEPNYDFDHAAGIGLNVKYTNINFVPLPGQTINNDFFQVRVKRGMLVTCETLDLSAGTDTNMILYDNDRNGLAGNDDVDLAHGDLRSRVTVSINYDGYLYVLVGQGFAVPPAQAGQYTYSLQCTSGPPNVTSTPAPPTSTPRPFVPTSTPYAQPTPTPPPAVLPPTSLPVIVVRPMATPTPAGRAQQIVTADLRIAYDANGNGEADPGEGVVGLEAFVYDNTTVDLLAQGFTDDTGRAVFSVPSAGPIRVVVPYLGFEQVVLPPGAVIPVLISPRGLPEQIP